MRDDPNHRSHRGSTNQSPPCILVVDDDAGSRRLLARALEAAGFAAREASDGADALAAVAEELPDLILLDLEMPKLNGAETCSHLRAESNSAVSEIPVIMLTAHDDEEAEVRCLESGANDFLAKPVGRAALTARIQTQLRLRAMSLELHARNDELALWHANQLADLEAARITQRAIIPTRVPSLNGWEIEDLYTPVIQVGGDVYGWHTYSPKTCLLWMADATGHGASAALVTTLIAHLFHQAALFSKEPHAILREVNSEFFGLFRGKSFISACCIRLEEKGTVTISSAGHPPILIRRQKGDVENIMAHATVIGVTGELASDSSKTLLEPGDSLVTFTDGLYGLRHPSGDRMMWHTVAEALVHVNGQQQPLIPPLLERLKSYSDQAPNDDDVTVIAARRTTS